MLDYSNAPPQQDFGTIPDGTLAWAILSLRRGKEGTPETISNSGESSYLDFELTITEGPFAKRKVWEMVGTRGTEKYVNQGRSSIRSILEVGRGASAANMAGYQIAGYEQLDTLKVAIEIGVEKQQGYQDKNRVKSWLTPNTESSTHKKFAKLLAGETSAPAAAQTGSGVTTATWQQDAVAAGSAPFGGAAGKPPATATPSWLQGGAK
jgi:hypothetical protein